jgi:hypothetical protein
MFQRSRVLTALLMKNNRWCPTCTTRGLFASVSRKTSGSSNKTKLFALTVSSKNYTTDTKVLNYYIKIVSFDLTNFKCEFQVELN